MAGQFLSVLLLCYCISATVCDYTPDWDSLDSRPLPSWYDEAKIGVFMHWGIYSVPSFGEEWFWWYWRGTQYPAYVEFMESNYPPGFTYPDFAPMLKAEMFDPNEWADIVASSGAKYYILTSKHHEGFCNWKTATSQGWNSMDTGPQRDIVGELANAIRNRTNVHFGLYFSQYEWFNDWYLADKAAKFTSQVYPAMVSLPQMRELVNMYQPELIWSDGDWEAPDTYWNSTEFLAWLYNESPVKDTVVVNDRWGSGCMCKHGGYWTCQDRYNPGHLVDHKWENAMTLQQASWGYIRNTDITGYLNITTLIAELITTVSCGGNLAMNIGPTHDGRIMPIFKERFNQTGAWLAVNGEAIYSSSPWLFQNDTNTSYVWYTTNKKSGAVYAHLLEWPFNYKVMLGALKGMKPTNISLLGYGTTLTFSVLSDGVQVTLPFLPLDTPLKWAWVLRIEGLSSREEVQWKKLTKSSKTP